MFPGARFQAGAGGVEEVDGILHARKVLFLLFNLPFFAPSVHLQTLEEAKVTQPYPLEARSDRFPETSHRTTGDQKQLDDQ